jgi:hypothetical protein
MTMLRVSIAICAAFAAGMLPAGPAAAAAPSAGTVSTTSAQTWQGKTYLVSNPSSLADSGLGCRNDLTRALDPACDTFKLTVSPPLTGLYLVEVSIEAAAGNDFDLFVFNAAGNLIGISATATGNESIALSDLPAGTYDVVVEGWLVVPLASYSGTASIRTDVAPEETARSYRAVQVPEALYAQGPPANVSGGGGGQALRVRSTAVGREAAEPTVGVNRAGTAFYAAATFDALPAGSPINLARTEILRSRDGGLTWMTVQPPLLDTTEPPATLDPYVYVEEDSGRVFAIDLYVGCSYLLASDNEGESWQRNPLACGDFINDHQTLFAGPPPPGLSTQGFPEVLYYCFNRIADSSCGRSLDGGLTFLPTRDPAYLGVDGGVCGGLHAHGTTDSAGRVFLPKGHCDVATVAISEDGADSWTRVAINGFMATADHEVNVAVDAADNLYAVWWDARDRLPYLATSTDHGTTWSVPVMIAPPGVHEVNFPTLAAGDAGRIALSFPGTTSQARGDLTRPWSYYVLVSTNALEPTPKFTWTTANGAADPIHRGECGPGRCAGMLDFLDILVSPHDGSVWATAVDTCTGACVTDATAEADASVGLAVRQVKGPSLWERRRR